MKIIALRSSPSPDITLRVKCKAGGTALKVPEMNRNATWRQVRSQMTTKSLQQHTQEIFTDMNAPHSTLK